MAKDYTYLFKTGRPTKFKPEYTAELIRFFDIKPTRRELMETVKEFGRDGVEKKVGEKYKHIPNKYPTLLRFAMKIKVNYESLRAWAEKGSDPMLDKKMAELKSLNKGFSKADLELMQQLKEFSAAYKMAKTLQEEFLMANGLNGASPSAAYIFTAKNKTTMRDKVENDVTIKQVKPLLDNLNPSYVHDNNSNEEGSRTD